MVHAYAWENDGLVFLAPKRQSATRFAPARRPGLSMQACKVTLVGTATVPSLRIMIDNPTSRSVQIRVLLAGGSIRILGRCNIHTSGDNVFVFHGSNAVSLL